MSDNGEIERRHPGGRGAQLPVSAQFPVPAQRGADISPEERAARAPQGVAARLLSVAVSDARLVERVRSAHRRVNMLRARELADIMELAHRRAGLSVEQLRSRRARSDKAISIGAQSVADELSCELVLSRNDAEHLVFTAVGLSLDAPDTFALFRAGDLDQPRAEAILGLVQTLILESRNDDPDGPSPEELAARLEEPLLKRAARQNLQNLRRSGRKALNAIDPEAAERRHAAKKERRLVRMFAQDDSMCELSAYLPADQAHQAMAALTALAKAAIGDDDPRTLDQARVDVLVDVLPNALTALNGTDVQCHCTHPQHQPRPDHASPAPGEESSGSPRPDGDHPAAQETAAPGHHPADTLAADPDPDPDKFAQSAQGECCCWRPIPDPDSDRPEILPARKHLQAKARVQASIRRAITPGPQIIVVINADTLLGLNDNPAYLQGHGPIIASMARDLAATGTWRCAVTDTQHGTLDALATSTYTPAYRPTRKLRRHLTTRDQRCRFPGCTRPAQYTDIDHVTPHPDGVTCECNLECLCAPTIASNMRQASESRFSTAAHHPPGTLIWTTPSGRQHIDYPDPLDPTAFGYCPVPEHPAAQPAPPNGTRKGTQTGHVSHRHRRRPSPISGRHLSDPSPVAPTRNSRSVECDGRRQHRDPVPIAGRSARRPAAIPAGRRNDDPLSAAGRLAAAGIRVGESGPSGRRAR